MTLEVATVIYLRERIEALQREEPRTRAGREGLQVAIAELERDIEKIRGVKS